jgi:SH3-like domain-containing protein
MLVGVVVAAVVVVQSCLPEREEVTTTVTVETPEHVTAPREEDKVVRDDKGYYVAKTGIPLFKHPDLNAGFTTVITPGAKFKVTRQRRDWFRVKTEDGARGWVPEAIIQANLGEDFKLE